MKDISERILKQNLDRGDQPYIDEGRVAWIREDEIPEGAKGSSSSPSSSTLEKTRSLSPRILRRESENSEKEKVLGKEETNLSFGTAITLSAKEQMDRGERALAQRRLEEAEEAYIQAFNHLFFNEDKDLEIVCVERLGDVYRKKRTALFTFSVNFPKQLVVFSCLIVVFAYHGAAVVVGLECAHLPLRSQIGSHAWPQKSVPPQSFHQISVHQNCALWLILGGFLVSADETDESSVITYRFYPPHKNLIFEMSLLFLAPSPSTLASILPAKAHPVLELRDLALTSYAAPYLFLAIASKSSLNSSEEI
jgi:hypothetical protein